MADSRERHGIAARGRPRPAWSRWVGSLVLSCLALLGSSGPLSATPGTQRCDGPGNWGRKAKVQLIVLSQGWAANAGAQSEEALSALHGLIHADLSEIGRPRAQDLGERAPSPLFDLSESDRLETALRRELASLGAKQRMPLVHARFGLADAPRGDGPRAYPSWVCEQLTAGEDDLAVLAYVDEKGASLKIVLAEPCMELGAQTEVLAGAQGTETAERLATLLHDSLVQLLESRYWSSIRVLGPPGTVLLVDGETVGRLPLAAPLCTAPGRRSLRARGAEGCARLDSVSPGDGDWLVEPGVCESPRRLFTWIAAGSAATLGVAGLVSHWLASEQLATAEGADRDRIGAEEDRAEARRGMVRSNVLYGLAGAAAVGAAVLFIYEPTWRSEVAVAPLPEGGGMVTLRGTF